MYQICATLRHKKHVKPLTDGALELAQTPAAPVVGGRADATILALEQRNGLLKSLLAVAVAALPDGNPMKTAINPPPTPEHLRAAVAAASARTTGAAS